MPALGLDAGVGREAAKLRVYGLQRRGRGDHRAGDALAVEDEDRGGGQRRRVERLGTLQPDLLAGREDELHVGGRRLFGQIAQHEKKGRHRGRHMLRGDVHTKEVRHHTREHRRTMRVARRYGKTRVTHLGFRAQPAQDLDAHGGRHTDVIHRDQHCRPLLVAANRQRFRKQRLLDALVHVASAAVPAEPYRIVRGDVHRRDTDLPRHRLGRRIGG